MHVTRAELSYQDVKNVKQFKDVGKELQAWFKVQMQGGKAGVLVSHNVTVDVEFLSAEYQRADMRFLPGMTKSLDTLNVL